jgi:outer membrane lipoprotein-sorting protein
MKKKLVSVGLGLIALLTVTTSFAKSNNHAHALTTSSDEKVTKLKTGSLVINGNAMSAYDKNGNWVYTIARYNADNLPKDIFDIARKDYASYYISGMEKVDRPGFEPVYIVHMEDKTTIKTVRVSEGETELVKDYIKG